MRTAAPQCEVKVKCPCGKTHVFDCGHYDRVIVGCGRPFWALQPKRNGPLVMFLWPGPNLTAREMAEKESVEDGTPFFGSQNYD
jgi:hypothetical protein